MSNLESLVNDWVTLPEAGDMMDLPITKMHTMLDERALLAVRIGERKIRRIPAAFIVEGHVLESLKGTISVLSDAGFTDEEMLSWLFTPDDSLPGRPVDALREGRKTEIRRRAQALAW